MTLLRNGRPIPALPTYLSRKVPYWARRIIAYLRNFIFILFVASGVEQMMAAVLSRCRGGGHGVGSLTEGSDARIVWAWVLWGR